MSASPRLDAALTTGDLVILAGAGVSRLGPSYLPGWYDFNKSLLDEAKACALRGLPDLDATAVAAINGLDIGQIPVEAFSDLIVRSFASDGYFTVLDVLDADQTNANHQALAALAKLGRLKAIVTTNFDTLIERACRDAGVAVTVLTGHDLITGGVPDGFVLYKIHGSVTAASTLVDTVGQKLRGLPEPIRARLGELFGGNHLLVLGYSGGDLKFGRDYLMLSAIDDDAPGFSWVFQPGSKPGAEVTALKARLGDRGAIITAALPEFFSTLGVDAASPEPATDEASSRYAVQRRAAERIRKFFDERYVGPLSSAAFCAGLLARTGHDASAAAIRRGLADEAERWGTQMPVTSAIVFRTLATGAMRNGDVKTAERWTRMEIGFWESLETHLAVDAPDDARRDLLNSTAIVWRNLAVVQRAHHDYASAKASIARAGELARRSGHPGLTSDVLQELAHYLAEAEPDADLQVSVLRRAVSAAIEDGSARRVTSTLADLGELLIDLGEYFLAKKELARAGGYLALAVDADDAERIEIALASIEARRNNPSQAAARLQPLVDRHAAHTPAGARVRAALARFIGHDDHWRPNALAMIDDVAAAMDDGRLAAASLPQVPPRDALASLRSARAAGGRSALLTLLHVDDTIDEVSSRGQIVLAEFAQFPWVLPSFYGQLCHAAKARGAWLRVMDLAQGLFFSAGIVGDTARQLEATNLMGTARAILGNLRGAVGELESALPGAPPGPLRDAITANIGTIRAATEPVPPASLSMPAVDAPPPPAAAAAWIGAAQRLAMNDVVGAVALLAAARGGR